MMKQKGIVFLFIWAASAMVFCQQVTVTSPNGGENWKSGVSRDITWAFSGIPDPSHTYIKLVLFKGGTASGNKIGNIVQNIPAAPASYSWPVGKYVGGTAVPGNDYYIRIIHMNGTFKDESNGPFTISPPLPTIGTKTGFGGKIIQIQKMLVLTSPNGGEKWPNDSNQSITWMSMKLSSQNIKLMIYIDSQDDSPRMIAHDVPIEQSSFNWKVGDCEGTHIFPKDGCTIRIVTNDGKYEDTSDDSFSIVGKSNLTISKVWWTNYPNVIAAGAKIDLMLWVKNTGIDFSTPSQASFKVNGALIGKRDIPAIGPNEEYYVPVPCPWTVTCPASVVITVDCDNQVAESNEADNTWTKANFCADWSKN
jgi:hypothetical protein